MDTKCLRWSGFYDISRFAFIREHHKIAFQLNSSPNIPIISTTYLQNYERRESAAISWLILYRFIEFEGNDQRPSNRTTPYEQFTIENVEENMSTISHEELLIAA